MNDAAKLQFSGGPTEGGPPGGSPVYQNTNNPPVWGLSAEERAFAGEPAWMLMKNRIVEKTVGWFARIGEHMQALALRTPRLGEGGSRPGLLREVGSSGGLLADVAGTPPKISRGENFKGLPWVVLDYPRQFGKEDIFAIRTLFWWGNYFSVTLHVKGRFKTICLPALRSHTDELAAAGFHIGIATDEWRHEHEPDNYRPLAGLSPEEWEGVAGPNAFLKLSAKCSLEGANAPDGLASEESGPAAEILRLYEVLIRALAGA